MSEEVMYQLLTGPVAALALCVFCLVAVARWAGANIPKIIDRHMKQIDQLVDSHNQDREMYRESLQTMSGSLRDLNAEVDIIKDDVREIKFAVKK